MFFYIQNQNYFLDHKIVNTLLLSALSAAESKCYKGAGGKSHSVELILGYEVWYPINSYQIAVNISSTIKRKIQAIRCHKSQIDSVKYDDAFIGLAKYRGILSQKGRYAEVFEIYKADDKILSLF